MRITLALLPIAALLVNVCSHVVLFRCRIVRSMLKAIFAGFVLGLVFLWISAWALIWTLPEPTKALPFFILNTLTYGLLGYNYFHFTNLGETARRIRILREFFEHGSMSEEELLKYYNARDMVQLRLGRLIRNSQVEIAQGGVMKIKDRSVLRMANMMVMLKRLILHKKT